IIEDGYIHGVHYRGRDGWHEVRAVLTIAADGRFSRVRKLAGFEPVKTAPPMDVLWFRLSLKAGDPKESTGRLAPAQILVILNRADYWLVVFIIPKGGYQKIHAASMEAMRNELSEL